MNSDQKLQNSLYINEFNQRWDNGTKKLIEKCSEEFKGEKYIQRHIAESKLTTDDTNEPFTHKKAIAKHKKEAKMWKAVAHSESKDITFNQSSKDRNCEKDQMKNTTIKQGKDIGQKSSKLDVTPRSFGVSVEEFQTFLAFGIRFFIQVEKAHKKRIKAIETQEKSDKIKEAKRAHEIWLEKKRRDEKMQKEEEQNNIIIYDKRVEQSLKNHPHLLMSPRLLGAKNNETSTARRQIPTPKMWINMENISENSAVILLQWKTLLELSSSDFLIVSVTECSESSPFKFWRDPAEKGGKLKLKEKIELNTSSSYYISIQTYTPTGMSPKCKVHIPCRPRSPDAPILLNASESSIKISWIALKTFSETERDDSSDKNCFSYNVSLCVDDDKNQWVNVWKGHTNVAIISGLNSDTMYKMRVSCTNYVGLESLPSDSSIFCTRIRALATPKLINHGTDFIELSWEKAELGSVYSSRGYSVSLNKVFQEVDTEHKGWIDEAQFNNFLSILGIISNEESYKVARKFVSLNKGKIKFIEFQIWWNSNVTYNVSKKHKNDCEGIIVYSGSETNVSLKGLTENTDFYFDVSCTTIRGCSLRCSNSLHVKTLPEPPTKIAVLHLEASVIIIKIWFESGTKIKVDKIEELTKNNGTITEQKLSTVYEGTSNIIKIPSLRSNRAYKFRCQCINDMGGKSIFFFSETSRTTNMPFLLSPKRIADLFVIDCTNDIVQGDLIFFTEQDSNRLDELGAVCIVARVMYMQSSDKTLRLEIEWVSSTYQAGQRRQRNLQVGMVIERKSVAINTFEVLRMPWVDEGKRNKES